LKKDRIMTLPSLTARHWIGGEWVDSENRLSSINPATGDAIGTYADGGKVEAARAISAARRAFMETEWRHDRRLRARAIHEMADRFEARMDDLVEILSIENGKIIAEARFEVSMVPPKLRFYAALTLTEFGRAIEIAPGRYSTVYREAMGVAGVIAPWNSPIVLFVRSLAPALAAGCTVVGKLPGWTAQINARMCEGFAEVDSLPRGVIKQSGLGRLNGIAAMEDFIEYKTIVHEIDLDPGDGIESD
jgi:betaine-aldehyde dehydrogenase